jgi:hypothetical protein
VPERHKLFSPKAYQWPGPLHPDHRLRDGDVPTDFLVHRIRLIKRQAGNISAESAVARKIFDLWRIILKWAHSFSVWRR